MTFSQSDYDIRCEWGIQGIQTLAVHCDALIIVDVLSFSTAVTIAVENGGIVFPYRWKDDSRVTFAEQHQATLAGPRKQGGYSLSPASLTAVQTGQRLVLPSPNGSTLSLATGDTPTYAGCLRNAKAVAEAAQTHGNRVGVVPCGERWRADESLRPALEDLIGAGAIIHYLLGQKSIEAQAAEWVYQQAVNHLYENVINTSSGKELQTAGYENDVKLACELNQTTIAPRLIDGAYQTKQS